MSYIDVRSFLDDYMRLLKSTNQDKFLYKFYDDKFKSYFKLSYSLLPFHKNENFMARYVELYKGVSGLFKPSLELGLDFPNSGFIIGDMYCEGKFSSLLSFYGFLNATFNSKNSFSLSLYSLDSLVYDEKPILVPEIDLGDVSIIDSDISGIDIDIELDDGDDVVVGEFDNTYLFPNYNDICNVSIAEFFGDLISSKNVDGFINFDGKRYLINATSIIRNNISDYVDVLSKDKDVHVEYLPDTYLYLSIPAKYVLNSSGGKSLYYLVDFLVNK